MINVSTPASRQNPKIYTACGKLLDGTDTTIEGYGVATVVIIGNLAQVDFTVKITAEEDEKVISIYGLNANLLKTANNNIPQITPVRGGRILYFREGILSCSGLDTDPKNMVAYGMDANANGNFWTPQRMYNYENKAVGSWMTNCIFTADIITGTVYGTVA